MRKFLTVTILLALIVTTVYGGTRLAMNKLFASTTSSSAIPGAEALNLMPDSDAVVLIDVARIFNSHLVSSITNDPKANDGLKKFEAEALKFGVNLRQLKQIAIGGRTTGSKKGTGYAIITGSFDREKILAALAGQAEKINLEAEEYNGRTLYVITDKTGTGSQLSGFAANGNGVNIDRVGLSFLNQETVVVGDINGVKKVLDVQAGKAPNVMTNQQMASYISSTNAGAMLRFAYVLPDSNRVDEETASKPTTDKKPKVLTNEELGAPAPGSKPNKNDDPAAGGDDLNFNKMVESIRGAYGSLDLDKGFQVDTTLLIRTEGEAKKMSDSANGLLLLGRGMLGNNAEKDPQAAKLIEVLNYINISAIGKDVKVNIDIPQKLIDEIIAIMNKKS